MHPLLEELRKVIELERDKGCTDSAAIGGLDRYLRSWRQRSTAFLGSELRRFPRFDGPDYASLGPMARQAWLNRALSWIARSSQATEAPPSGTAPSSVKSRQSRPRTLPPRRRRARRETAMEITLDSSVTAIVGVSQTIAKRLANLGIATIRDILYHLPNRYNDLSAVVPVADLQVGEQQTVVVNVWEAHATRIGRRMRGTEAVVGDATGNIRVVWFNNPYVARRLSADTRVMISGRVGLHRGRKVFESPEWEVWGQAEDLIHVGRIVPVYPLTAGIGARQMRRLTKSALDSFAPAIPEFLPPPVLERQGLMGLAEALGQVHFPDSLAAKDEARRRLAFDEFFILQLGLRGRRRQWQEVRVDPIPIDDRVVDGFVASLPFQLTGAQRRTLGEILADIAIQKPMSRLLQGEVGSGKTVVALAAVLVAAAAGFQAVIMAPTEILAEQHHRTISRLLADGRLEDDIFHLPYVERPLRLALLTGSTPTAQRRAVYEAAASGEVDIVVGTHALIQGSLEFARLGLAVADEQHRFGVMQRAALRQKGGGPVHLLVMSATPIPRTMALTLYGDLDLSVLDELPPGRQAIETRYLRSGERNWAYAFIREQVAAGRQAFVICPLVEESDVLQARAAVAEFERLKQEVFPDLRLGLLHGRMSAAEKDEAMQRFRDGELDILVSTPVVEVGIDVPNATVMLIEGADRFGLSQMHQFRGRVGRGEHRGYCFLLSESPSATVRERMHLLEENRDGFALAEADLQMRGPGDFFGTRQSGLPELRTASLSDTAVLEVARGEAIAVFDADPDLERHPEMRAEVQRLWRRGGDLS